MKEEQVTLDVKKANQVHVDELDVYMVDSLIKLAVYISADILDTGDTFQEGNIQGSKISGLSALLSLTCDKYQTIVGAFDPLFVLEHDEPR